MIRRWSHVHSLATGLVFGLVLDRQVIFVAVIFFAIGVVVTVGWSKLRQLAGWSREAAAGALSSIERLREAEIERKLAVAAEARTRAETRLRRAGEQETAERRAYWSGAVDGGRLDDDEGPKTILGVPVPVREEA